MIRSAGKFAVVISLIVVSVCPAPPPAATPDVSVADDITVSLVGRIQPVTDPILLSTNATAANRVTVSGSGKITGDVNVGPGGVPATVIKLTSGGQITGVQGVQTVGILFPDIDEPTGMGASVGNKTYTSGSTTTLSANLHCDDLTVTNLAVLQISGNVKILVEDDFKVENIGRIRLLDGATLEIYVKSEVKIQTAAQFNATTWDPSLVKLFVLGSDPVTIQGLANVFCIINAPYADLRVRTASRLRGTFQGAGLEVSGFSIFEVVKTASQLFSDVSVATGFNVQTATDANMGASLHWGDLDNDGDLDAVVNGNSTARKMLSVSQGTTFVASTFGGGDVRRQGALADMDNDGDLDFWSVSVGGWDTESYFENNGLGVFTDRSHVGLNGPSNNEGLGLADVNGDGWMDVLMFSGDANWIGLNQATTPLTIVASADAAYGLDDPGDYGNGVFVSSGDVNNDGFADFFQHYAGGRLFLSDGDGTFTENTGAISIVTADGASTDKAGSAWADFDNDGDLDLFAARFDSGQKGYLWKNTGGVFSNVTTSAGINDTTGQRSGCWGDYDNDGDLDLYVVTRGNNANVMYQSMGDGTFTTVDEGAAATGDGHDCVFVDYDNDGDLDLSVTQEDATNTLLQNKLNNNNYLEVRAVGGGSGRTVKSANGARVELFAADGVTLLARRDLAAGRGYGGAEPMWVHFGGVDAAASYVVKVHFRSSVATTTVVPSLASTTIGATTIPQMLTVEEPARLMVKRFWTKSAEQRGTAMTTLRSAPGFVRPVKDLVHLRSLPQ
ncbi:MAG: VCBS repeat-containing protein [Phycisphaerales bacterium]|nr:VCBS repeat-containing protein [Phycisphaerales bacterium]